MTCRQEELHLVEDVQCAVHYVVSVLYFGLSPLIDLRVVPCMLCTQGRQAQRGQHRQVAVCVDPEASGQGLGQRGRGFRFTGSHVSWVRAHVQIAIAKLWKLALQHKPSDLLDEYEIQCFLLRFLLSFAVLTCSLYKFLFPTSLKAAKGLELPLLSWEYVRPNFFISALYAMR